MFRLRLPASVFSCIPWLKRIYPVQTHTAAGKGGNGYVRKTSISLSFLYQEVILEAPLVEAGSLYRQGLTFEAIKQQQNQE